MARKYMTVEFIGDQSKIQSIIQTCRPNIKFVKFSYVRDDRVVSLSTNDVYINDAPSADYTNTESVYSRSGEMDLAYDDIANAKLIDNKLVGDRVMCRLGSNDKIQFELEEYTIINFNKGYCNIHYTTLTEIIVFCSKTSGLEYVAEGMNDLLQYYNVEDYSASWFLKLWWIVDYYSLYDLLNEYSNLLSYYEEISLDNSQDNFFAAANFVPDFLFRCSNYYLARKQGSSSPWNSKLNVLKNTSTLAEFYTSLSCACQQAFIEGAKNERYDIMAFRELSYMKQDIIKYANDSPLFFCDYMLKAKTHENHESILASFRRDYVELVNCNMSLKYENIKKLQFNQKARALNCSIGELFDIMESINTKEGIIEYLNKSEID